MQVSAQGGQQTAPLPPPQAQGNSHARTVLEGSWLIHTRAVLVQLAACSSQAVHSSCVLQSVSRDGGEDIFWTSGCFSTI